MKRVLIGKRPRRCALVAASVLLCIGIAPGIAGATFAGVNGKITFTSAVGSHNDLFQIDQNLPPYQPFEAFPSGSVNSPRTDQLALWSPDGRKLLFESHRDGDPEIYVWDSVSSVTTQLTFNKVEDTGAGWSPDGSQIVFTREVTHPSVKGKQTYLSKRDLFIMPAGGGDPRNLTNSPGLDSGRGWSPDGNEILFTSDRDGDWEIYGIDPISGSTRQVTHNIGIADFNADWSPDGKSILFTREPGSPEETAFGDSQIWTMDANGNGATLLVNNGPGVDKHPTWSPDGTKIAWVSTTSATGSDYELYEADSNGTAIVRLTNDAAHQFAPDYRPTR